MLRNEKFSKKKNSSIKVMTINWGGWAFSTVVLLLLFVAGMILKDPVRLSITGKRTEGIVVPITKSESSEQDTLQAPIIEFITSAGERDSVKSRDFSSWSSVRLGDKVTVAYNPSNPKDAQLLRLGEFRSVGFLLCFITFIILMWIIAIVGSGSSTFDDPFHLLPKLIAHFHLNPVRFPALFILSLAIPACGIGVYWTYNTATNLRDNGIKTVGHVTGSEWDSSTMSDGSKATGLFPMITFEDTSGTSHTIRRSLAMPLSRLKAGETVEVIYLTGKADQGVVNTWDEFWPPPIFFGLMCIAFLLAFRLVLNGSMGDSKSNSNSQKKLLTTGVPAIATVLSANPKDRLLRFRIDKDTLLPSTKLDAFISLENTLSDWKPPKTGAQITKGDQFRAYLDSIKPFDNFYIDFSQRLGSDRYVKSIDEEDEEADENWKMIAGKLADLLTTSSPYVSPESHSEIETIIKNNDLSLAFEKLMTRIMNMPKPLPESLQSIDWDDCLEIGVKLEFDEFAEEDPAFWKKFQVFKDEINK